MSAHSLGDRKEAPAGGTAKTRFSYKLKVVRVLDQLIRVLTSKRRLIVSAPERLTGRILLNQQACQ